jgi:hypothetical protein
MSLDFQQVRQQVQKLGEGARERSRQLALRRESAHSSLEIQRSNFDFLRQRARTIAAQHDPNLRCAMPAQENPEPLNACFPLPEAPKEATLIAADGSQISPDRHSQVNYGLINVGAICMRLGCAESPSLFVRSQLLGDDVLDELGGMISDQQISLWRDLSERQTLAELASTAHGPVITLTDGPLELWGAPETGGGDYQTSLKQYLAVLEQMRAQSVTTAGYVDKPAANLVVRLLEVAALDESDLKEVKNFKPYAGVTDRDLFSALLEPGDRSAVFQMQSRGQLQYEDGLKVHFFYLNVGRPGHPWLARVEMPAWVAAEKTMLDNLHAVLLQQCRALGLRAFPYILHRAHEAAVVTFEEKDQVTQMIVHELYRRGVGVGETSHKQVAKEGAKRTAFKR